MYTSDTEYELEEDVSCNLHVFSNVISLNFDKLNFYYTQAGKIIKFYLRIWSHNYYFI